MRSGALFWPAGKHNTEDGRKGLSSEERQGNMVLLSSGADVTMETRCFTGFVQHFRKISIILMEGQGTPSFVEEKQRI